MTSEATQLGIVDKSRGSLVFLTEAMNTKSHIDNKTTRNLMLSAWIVNKLPNRFLSYVFASLLK